MTPRSPSELPFRFGCPLALAVTLAFVSAGEWLVYSRPPGDWQFYAFETFFSGVPFVVLAVARARDRVAWVVGIALTAALWAYLAYDVSLHRGADFSLLFVLLLVPVLIAGSCLIIAGMRGGIPWARDGGDAADDSEDG